MDERLVISKVCYRGSYDFTFGDNITLRDLSLTNATIGPNPNVNIINLNTGVLKLQPADGSVGGALITTSQTFTGMLGEQCFSYLSE